ncbi:DUF4118 domain-containing protein [Plasticicumulans sp.]|uniref:DUF4118 domain-containing protein n=1 Tax=Plasticicumulans sp. TaxID=2307179 RepID=UPI003955B6CC
MSRRPDPDALLALAQHEERRTRGGRLKVFLGAAPGVGKTWAMLEAAHAQREAGIDVVAGLVECHGRSETEALLDGLELLPRQTSAWHGVHLEEFDLDAALARRPALLLVDELAHSNAPGARHAKRWQDVQELLARGIDVYTTLNIQHLESLNDVVAGITGIIVRETVPDAVLEQADAVELVDLPPAELLARLRAGKVYLPAQAERAREHFFREANLAALRELALRQTAAQVNAQVLTLKAGTAPAATWQPAARILACVGPGDGARTVRAARRLAGQMHAEWTAVHVETPAIARRPAAERAGTIATLRLAEQLGGETLTLAGRAIADEILSHARARNVTRIVVGRSRRRGWRARLVPGLVDALLRGAGDIEIHAVPAPAATPEPAAAAAASAPLPPATPVPWRGYGLAFAGVMLATAVAHLMTPRFELANLIMVYLLAVVFVARRGEREPALLAAVLAVLAFDFFFVPPQLTFAVSDTQYLVTFAIMLVVGGIISQLTVREHEQTEHARLRERRTAALHRLSKNLASLRGADALLDAAVRHIAEVFEAEVLALLPDDAGRLTVRAGWHASFAMDAKEQSVAQWVHDLGRAAGLGTATLPYVDAVYVPLLGKRGAVGALRVKPALAERLVLPEQMRLLEAFANQTALALEVDRLGEEAREAKLAAETERLRSSLLASVSHDLRTPLAAIIGSASSLAEYGDGLDAEERRELALNIHAEAERLNRLVANLLQATRLEAGTLTPLREAHDLEAVIGSALERLSRALAGRPFHTDIADGLPLVSIDALLIEQVFVNLIDNALRYTPAGSPIELTVRLEDGDVRVELADRGPGLPAAALGQVFERFWRGAPDSHPGGAGLGLAICRGIVELHGGRIEALNRTGGGAVFRFTLPVALSLALADAGELP